MVIRGIGPIVARMDEEHTDKPEEQGPDAPPPEDIELELEGYLLQREITRGGQAIIFSAIKKSTGRKVAVKFFPGGSYATRKEKVRMDREVRVLAALDHPNIVSVIDRGQTPDGSTYFVLEYVHGKTLAEFIDDYWDRHAPARTVDDLRELLQLFVRIADAVNAAHLRGVVHRDLKPSNIIIDGYGEPHILDFGVALSAVPLTDDGGEPLPSVTWTGEFLGSVQWASPEQAEGDQTKIDVRSDVYSLGVILYEVLTGDFPYDVFGTLPEILKNIMESRPRPPSEVFRERTEDDQRSDSGACPIDPLLDGIVLRALEKNRDDRYQTAGEFSKAVSSYLGGKTAFLKSALPRRPKWAPALAAVGGAVLLAASVFWVTRWHLTRSAPEVRAPDSPRAVSEPARYRNVYGYRMDGDEVVFEFDPRDYDVARMADGSLGQVADVPSVNRVAIAGPFNEWDPRDEDWIMTRVMRNRFELRKALDHFEGRHEWPFKFVINEQIWVSAPRMADNKEVVIEDTATYNLLFANPMEQPDEAIEALHEYRDRVSRIWPAQSENLVLDPNGHFHLTLTHVDPGARIRSLQPLADIPLTSLNLGDVRVSDLSALGEMETLRWFVCGDTTFNALFFGMNSALRDDDYEEARRAVESAAAPFEGVPAFNKARALFTASLEGMQALAEQPDEIPDVAETFEGRRYLYIVQRKSWTDARRYAERHDATLASIRSQELQDWVVERYGWPTLGRTLWLGGTDEQVRGSWGWLSADPWLYENWSPGYPDRHDERARALAMQHDGWWVNLDGGTQQLPFLIEWEE